MILLLDTPLHRVIEGYLKSCRFWVDRAKDPDEQVHRSVCLHCARENLDLAKHYTEMLEDNL